MSYRKTQAFLGDVPDWLAEVGLARAPDHNTLWRAFGALLKTRRVERALDLLADDAADALPLQLRVKPLTIDSTCYEPRHRSRHYRSGLPQDGPEAGAEVQQTPGKMGPFRQRVTISEAATDAQAGAGGGGRQPSHPRGPSIDRQWLGCAGLRAAVVSL